MAAAAWRYWTHTRKVVCVARNYAAHAAEMGAEAKKSPVFFVKPATSLLPVGMGAIEVPEGTTVHHEVELGVVIGLPGRRIAAADAMSHVAGYCISLDMTARNLQSAAKAKGHPWSLSKGFDTFAPVGPFLPASKVADPHNLGIWLQINGKDVQRGTTAQMIHKIPKLIEHASAWTTLEPGDVIMTGTPEGVGPVLPGQSLRAGLDLPNGSCLTQAIWSVEAAPGLPS